MAKSIHFMELFYWLWLTLKQLISLADLRRVLGSVYASVVTAWQRFLTCKPRYILYGMYYFRSCMLRWLDYMHVAMHAPTLNSLYDEAHACNYRPK